MRRIKLAILFLGTFLLLISIYKFFVYFNNLSNSGSVQINTSESTLTSYIYNSSSTYYSLGSGDVKFRIKPGHYSMLFDYNNNLSYRNIVVTNGSSQNISINIVDQFLKNTDTNNLIKLLPQYGPAFEYSITYSYSFSSGIAMPLVTISYTDQKSLSDALAWLEQVGANYSLLNINKVPVSSVPFN